MAKHKLSELERQSACNTQEHALLPMVEQPQQSKPQFQTQSKPQLWQQELPLENQQHPVLTALSTLDPDDLTARQALELLYQLKRQL